MNDDDGGQHADQSQYDGGQHAHGGEPAASDSVNSNELRTEEQIVTDPVRIRALAHPFRLQLLDYLQEVAQATATECAAALNESVASCSFHLRTLAKHGYIEPAPRAGREKPWKLVSRRRTQTIDNAQPGSTEAVSSLAALQVDRQTARIHDWLRAAPSLPAEDTAAAAISSGSFYATGEEVRELREQILQLTDRFEARWTNPELRPAGARIARLFAVLNFDPEEAE